MKPLNKTELSKLRAILVPRLFSFPFSREKKTLVGAGHVAPRIWEVKNIYFGGGDTKALCVFFSV
jgi:hypothetical protein